MFEVEKTFLLDGVDEDRLLHGAEFVKEIVIDDTYYDTPECTLTLQDKWLRKRKGAFELKVNMVDTDRSEQEVDQFHEIETEQEIRAVLDLPKVHDLETDLQKAEYEPIAQFKTYRKKYKHGKFVLDLDETDFGLRIGEIELVVDSEDKMAGALQEILDFAASRGVSFKIVPGKLQTLLGQTKPEYEQKLIDAKVFLGRTA